MLLLLIPAAAATTCAALLLLLKLATKPLNLHNGMCDGRHGRSIYIPGGGLRCYCCSLHTG